MPYNIGIDMGEHTTRLAVRGRGVLLRQSSAVAFRKGRQEPLAYGDEALKYADCLPHIASVAYPFRSGGISDDEILAKYLRFLFKTATDSGLVHRVRAILLCDAQTQPFTVRHLAATAIDCGAAGCAVVRSDFMAALGASLDVVRPEASLLADIGAGKVTVTIISSGRVIVSESLPFGMRRIDEAIVRAMRVKYGLIIGERTAEESKLSLGAAIGGNPELKAAVVGMKALTGFPGTVSVTADEIYAVMEPVIAAICDLTASVVERASVELAADLNDSGIALTGGGAQLFGLDKLIAERTGLTCRVVGDPSSAAILGVCRALEKPEQYEAMVDAHRFRWTKNSPSWRGDSAK